MSGESPQAPGIIRPLEQRLTLPGAAIAVAAAAVLLPLRDMSTKREPALDLAVVVRAPSFPPIDRESSHRALDRVLGSIEELRSYRRRLFSEGAQ